MDVVVHNMSTNSTRGDHSDWIWRAIAAGDLELAKVGTSKFDFTGVHPEFGTPLLAFYKNYICGNGNFTDGSRRKLCTNTVEWLIQNGAELNTLIPETVPPMCLSFYSENKGKTDAEIPAGKQFTEVKVNVAGLTVMGALINVRNAFGKAEDQFPIWGSSVALMNHLIQKITENAATLPSNSVGDALRTTVPDAVVEVWERVLEQAQEEGDVRIISTSSSGDQSSDHWIRVHSFILEAASPVLKAMLQSPMQEGGAGSGSGSGCDGVVKRIRVDEPAKAVRALVCLLYTGALPMEDADGADEAAKAKGGEQRNPGEAQQFNPGVRRRTNELGRMQGANAAIRVVGWEEEQEQPIPLSPPGGTTCAAETLLDVFRLCHRWQLSSSLATLLEARLSKLVTPKNLEEILEAAVLQSAPALRSACVEVARGSKEVEAKFRRGELRPLVAGELRCVFRPPGTDVFPEDVRKKRLKRDPL